MAYNGVEDANIEEDSRGNNPGGGVRVVEGTITKQSGGVIYGSDPGDRLKTPLRAVGPGIALDSSKDSPAGAGNSGK